jgi:hypothetical protein
MLYSNHLNEVRGISPHVEFEVKKSCNDSIDRKSIFLF